MTTPSLLSSLLPTPVSVGRSYAPVRRRVTASLVKRFDMVNIHFIPFVDLPRLNERSTGLVPLHNAVLMLNVVAMVHLMDLTWGTVRARITHLSPASVMRNVTATATATFAAG